MTTQKTNFTISSPSGKTFTVEAFDLYHAIDIVKGEKENNQYTNKQYLKLYSKFSKYR
jgi:hypothetical protein